MQPIELRARREALGLPQHELASWLGVAQATVSAWEVGRRTIPPGLHGELEELEEQLLDLADRMVEAGEAAGGECTLFTYLDDSQLAAAYPELDGWPAALHRVAAAQAAMALREAGVQATLATKPTDGQ
ncbi:DNA-binding transcriptional regulator [uncultured Tessaracoccus sp.]|uniref:helix-turn-helix domain-containing protein n=1 Tax=uncultured Tessaracoccus sp. TaxID=905023 RepID=UPI002619D12F|nr:DUF1870 family protein [uncultured Tessaracoccus sp.]